MKIPIKRYQKNAFIYLSGNLPPRLFYIIKSGQVKITRTNPVLGESEETRGPGYIIGVIQCITGIPAEENAVAKTDCELFLIDKDNIQDLFENHKKVILSMLSEYSEILRKLDADLINYNFFSSFTNRKEKIFDVVEKYRYLKQDNKARHLLMNMLLEYPNDPEILKQAQAIIPDITPMAVADNPDDLIYEKKFSPEEIIFTEFELATHFYIIKRGKVKITKLRHDKEILLAILGDADVFGEMAILNDKPRNATAVAITYTDVMVIDKKGIDKLPPPLFVKIFEFLTKRIWLVQQQLVCYKLPSVPAKIYYLLTSKIKQVLHNAEKEFSNSFVFKFPVSELYQMIDYDYTPRKREDVADFLDDKNIEFYHDSIKIKKIGALFDKNAYYFGRSVMSFNTTINDG